MEALVLNIVNKRAASRKPRSRKTNNKLEVGEYGNPREQHLFLLPRILPPLAPAVNQREVHHSVRSDKNYGENVNTSCPKNRFLLGDDKSLENCSLSPDSPGSCVLLSPRATKFPRDSLEFSWSPPSHLNHTNRAGHRLIKRRDLLQTGIYDLTTLI